MIITATISVKIVRADGTITKLSETNAHDAGDNPRYEHAETVKAIERSTDRILTRHANEATR